MRASQAAAAAAVIAQSVARDGPRRHRGAQGRTLRSEKLGNGREFLGRRPNRLSVRCLWATAEMTTVAGRGLNDAGVRIVCDHGPYRGGRVPPRRRIGMMNRKPAPWRWQRPASTGRNPRKPPETSGVPRTRPAIRTRFGQGADTAPDMCNTYVHKGLRFSEGATRGWGADSCRRAQGTVAMRRWVGSGCGSRGAPVGAGRLTFRGRGRRGRRGAGGGGGGRSRPWGRPRGCGAARRASR